MAMCQEGQILTNEIDQQQVVHLVTHPRRQWQERHHSNKELEQTQVAQFILPYIRLDITKLILNYKTSSTFSDKHWW